MSKAVRHQPPQSDKSEALLLAIVTLLVDQRERNSDSDSIKTEVLLAGAGLSYQQIAPMVNKKPDAVRMLIARSQPAASKGKSSKDSYGKRRP
jgi:DNA-directed RNA polymerase specialized sigma24 family protein